MIEITKGWAYTVASAYTKDPGSRDDLTQEALIAAWRAGDKGHRGGNQARAARQRLLDLSRRGQWFGRPTTRGVRSVPDLPALELVEERAAPMEDIDTRIDVQTAVGKLPAGWRRIVTMRFDEDRTWDEIAEVVGVSRPHVMKQWEEIAGHLRNELQEAA